MSLPHSRKLLTTLRDRIAPARTALLIVDMQNDYVAEGGASHKRHGTVAAVRAIIPTVQQLLLSARTAGAMVAYIQMTFDSELRLLSDVDYLRRVKRYGETPMVVKGTWGHEVVDELAPLPGDMRVEKQRSSAFVGTNLDLLLRSNHIQSVVVTGVVTQGCVLATASSALVHDYYVTVAHDCVASANKELHDAALLILRSSLVLEDSVVAARKIIDIWSE